MFLAFMACATVFGAYTSDIHGQLHMDEMTNTFWMLAVVLLIAKLSSLIEKIGQPSVLGELLIGVVLGNLVYFGIDFFELFKSNVYILFLAELGVVVLLFQVGLESTLKGMMGVGMKAFRVALVGVVTPFVLGTYFIGPLLMPGLSTNAYLFLGATLTATSVGITARVFKDLGRLHDPEAQIVLGAAVIDDILGLIILSVVSAMVIMGSITAGAVSFIVLKAIAFLVGALLFGAFLAKPLNSFLSKVHAGSGMKFTVLIFFCLIFSFIAHKLGLAPIVGAFAAGLVIEPKHFQSFDDPKIVMDLKGSINEHSEPHPLKAKVMSIVDFHSHRHIEEMFESVGYLLVPVFFVVMGMNVDISVFSDPSVIFVALGLTVVAVIGKLVSGLAAGSNVNKAIVGWGMVPRGEVGLIFAAIGKNLGVVNDQLFSIIVIMVILSTFITPPILTYLLKNK